MNICLQAYNHKGAIKQPVMKENEQANSLAKLSRVFSFHPNQVIDLHFNCNHHFRWYNTNVQEKSELISFRGKVFYFSNIGFRKVKRYIHYVQYTQIYMQYMQIKPYCSDVMCNNQKFEHAC